MPIGLPIQPIPNQTFTITLDGNLFDITIKALVDGMAVSIANNGTTIVDNAHVVSCAPIIPAKYLEAGNFLFLTANQQLPDYTQFGLTQSLLYFTADELGVLRVKPATTSRFVPTITASSFNPIAALPLRFAPQGYVAA